MTGRDRRTLSCLRQTWGGSQRRLGEPSDHNAGLIQSKREGGRKEGQVEEASRLQQGHCRVTLQKRPHLLGTGLLEYPCLLHHWLGAACGKHGLTADVEWTSEYSCWGSFSAAGSLPDAFS